MHQLVQPAAAKLGFGKLPGDLRFRLFGRDWFIPLTTTILLSFVASAIAKFHLDRVQEPARMKACVDLGGTKIAVGLAPAGAASGAEPAALLARRAEPTAKTGTPDAVAQQIIRLIDEACAEAGITRQQVEAVGVSSCGPFVLNGGLIELAAPNICGGLPARRAACPMTGPVQRSKPHCARCFPCCASRTTA